MKTSHILLALIVLLSITAGAASAEEITSREAKAAVAEVGQPAPSFSLPGVSGTERSLADFSGKFVVLEWVDFNCPFVRKHYDSKNMQNTQAKFRDKGVVWLSISSVASDDEDFLSGKELRLRLAEEKSAASDYLSDVSGEVAQRYGVSVAPTLLLIDPEGVLLYAGAIDDLPSSDTADIARATNYLEIALEAALGNRPAISEAPQAYGCSLSDTSHASR